MLSPTSNEIIEAIKLWRTYTHFNL